ncbi:MAG: hypothetical protein LWX54_16115 [Deltaproteobacteria bacterium]|nr:hypothetical protein [Deltaproteobacteria bacterium]
MRRTTIPDKAYSSTSPSAEVLTRSRMDSGTGTTSGGGGSGLCAIAEEDNKRQPRITESVVLISILLFVELNRLGKGRAEGRKLYSLRFPKPPYDPTD